MTDDTLECTKIFLVYLGGGAAGFLGLLTEKYGIEAMYFMCSFMPLAGLMAWFLPRIGNTQNLS